MPNHIFISHASKDDAFVKDLRMALEGQGVPVWVDSRNLRGGDKLAPEIKQVIETARQVLVVLSPNTINSPWVRAEIKQALQVEQQRRDEGYRVIPLLLPGVEPTALPNWFEEEPVGIPVRLEPGGLSQSLPAILAALGGRLPDDLQPMQKVAAPPLAELLLELRDPTIQTEEGKRRVSATATLTYTPPTYPTVPMVESVRYPFTAPLGPIEAGELRWYLEQYYLWPVGVFKERAERIEGQLPGWGRDLYQAALGPAAAQEALAAWQHAAGEAERRFSVKVDSDLSEGAAPEQQAAAREAASGLLSLPWELLHDGRGYLGQGKHTVQVRRRLPNRRRQEVRLTRLPIRILLVSPRPEDEHTGYFDHRSSALPLIEAVEQLGELAELTVLNPPTFAALEQAVVQAAKDKKPFDVIHFDGHGVYDREHGLGGLCFEDPKDSSKLAGRAMLLIHADDLAAASRDHRIPLVFLDACQTATIEDDPTASVAARLLEEGVTSVVAMSHSVLVETARRFVQAFYAELANGRTVGQAMAAGQQALQGNTYRGRIMGAGELRLQDWFVPVLYQEQQDPQVVAQLPPQAVRRLQERQRRLSLGGLPDPPPQSFVGRSRELLALERLLHDQPYAVVRGQGGAGKTTLAVELARWLARTGRFERVAFASVETTGEARAVLDSLGRQLLPGNGRGSGGAGEWRSGGAGEQRGMAGEQGGMAGEGSSYSVAHYPSLKEALQPVERALADRPTLIVLDNLESVLPGPAGSSEAAQTAELSELFGLCQALLQADPATRLLFTSREPLPPPFDHRQREIELGRLSRADAIELVGRVLAEAGLTPAETDPGRTPQEIADLVEAVNGHARALVLLAPDIAGRGVRATTANLSQLMAELDRRHPGDRQNSLYASLELSLRRLPPEMREQVKVLAPFHGGTNLLVLSFMFIADLENPGEAALDSAYQFASILASSLIKVGLVEPAAYNHLRLDPALPPYLWAQLAPAEQEQVQSRWAEGMGQLVGFLYQQRSQDAQLAAQLTLLELPNLLALLDWAVDRLSPEQMVGLAAHVEQLLANLGRPQALAQVVAVRERVASQLGEWSHARYLVEDQKIDRLLACGNLQAAYTTAQQLLQQSLTAGEAAYPGAAYDIAMAHSLLGRVLFRGGNAEVALQLLTEAQQRFQILANAGGISAEYEVSAAIIEQGDCLGALGRLDEAAAAYQDAIRRAEKLDIQRQVAVCKGNLGSIRLLQQRYAEALTIYTEARQIFERLGEPGSVAASWHQIGIIHREARQFDQAEQAYRQALAISVQKKDRPGEAKSLGELGNLYDDMGRLEEAIIFCRQAADIHLELQDWFEEGRDRNNIADTLIKLGRTDAARHELRRAIECDSHFGHAAEPWKTWKNLYNLEQATGNPQAAAWARQQAVETYLAYRRAGGENQSPKARLYLLVYTALRERNTGEAQQFLAELVGQKVPPPLKAMLLKLQAILAGERNPAMADDPALDYDDAAELRLLLEAVAR